MFFTILMFNYYLKDYFWAEDYRPLEKDPDKLELFSRYLKDCKDNQIKVVLVCSPTHTEDGFSHFDMKGFRELVDSIAKIEGIPFLDYSEFYGADTLYFIDPVHLKKDARRIYCEKIAEDLKTMGWTLNE